VKESELRVRLTGSAIRLRSGETGDSVPQRRGQAAQKHAKLSLARRQFTVYGNQAQVSRGGQIRVHRTLQQRRGHAADDHHGQQRHLEAGVEEAARAVGEQAERGKADSIQWVTLAVEKTANQIKGNHPE
jgi:hypothetical protein